MLAQGEQPIRMSVVGMSDKMLNTMRFFFQGQCNNSCEIASDKLAEVSIVDIDVVEGKRYLEQCRLQHPERPLILVSFDTPEMNNENVLCKPLTPSELRAAIERTTAEVLAVRNASTGVSHPEEKLSPQPNTKLATRVIHEEVKAPAAVEEAEAAVDANPGPTIRYPDEEEVKAYLGGESRSFPSTTDQLTNEQYDPGMFFEGHLRRAANEAGKYSRAIKLEMPGGNVVVLPGKSVSEPAEGTPGSSRSAQRARVIMNISPNALKNLSLQPIDSNRVSLSLLKNDPRLEAGAQIEAQDIESVLWDASVWAARGRLPIGTRLDVPVHLRNWPNITRLKLLPHSLRIAALWAEHPLSLAGTARMLGIEQHFIFAFYSATNALGLIEMKSRGPAAASAGYQATSEMVNSPPKKPKKRGLFGRILTHLRRG